MFCAKAQKNLRRQCVLGVCDNKRKNLVSEKYEFTGESKVTSGDAVVYGNAIIGGSATVTDDAVVCGCAVVSGGTVVSGDTVLDGTEDDKPSAQRIR